MGINDLMSRIQQLGAENKRLKQLLAKHGIAFEEELQELKK